MLREMRRKIRTVGLYMMILKLWISQGRWGEWKENERLIMEGLEVVVGGWRELRLSVRHMIDMRVWEFSWNGSLVALVFGGVSGVSNAGFWIRRHARISEPAQSS